VKLKAPVTASSGRSAMPVPRAAEWRVAVDVVRRYRALG
jgi:hypothetical protein